MGKRFANQYCGGVCSVPTNLFSEDSRLSINLIRQHDPGTNNYRSARIVYTKLLFDDLEARLSIYGGNNVGMKNHLMIAFLLNSRTFTPSLLIDNTVFIP